MKNHDQQSYEITIHYMTTAPATNTPAPVIVSMHNFNS